MRLFFLFFYFIQIAEASPPHFNQKEKEYFKYKHEIRVCVDPYWMPFEGLDKVGKYIGLGAAYFDIFREMLPIEIKVIKTKNWSQSIEFVKARKCDLLAFATETPTRKKYLTFTTPYFNVPLVLATTYDKPFVDDFNTLKTQKLGIPKSYAYFELLRNKYPNLSLVKVDNISDGLQQVVDGKLYGYIGALATVGYRFQHEFAGELKIAGRFKEVWKISSAIRNDDMMLLKIFEKLISNVDEATKQKILNDWTTIRYEKGTDYNLVWQILIASLIVLIFFIYYQRKLYNLNILLEEKIKSELKKNREKDSLLFQKTKMSALGEMISSIAHQWRQPLSELSMSQNIVLRSLEKNRIVSKEELKQTIEDEQEIVQFMSSTITTFQNFYKEDSEIKIFAVCDSYYDVKVLLSETIILNNIKLIEKINKNLILNGCKNCLSQVILSLLQNSIYFLKLRNISVPVISISIEKVNNYIEFKIEDNAGGVEKEIIENIFDCSFSKRDSDKKSTGLGLYISSLIIKEKFNAKIGISNTKDGVSFAITFLDI